MRNLSNILFIALFEKDVLKMVAVIAAAIGGGVVKVIFENKQKKLTFWQGLASFFVAIVAAYAALPIINDLLPESYTIAAIVIVALLSDNIFKYLLINFTDLFKALINKVWGITSK